MCGAACQQTSQQTNLKKLRLAKPTRSLKIKPWWIMFLNEVFNTQNQNNFKLYNLNPSRKELFNGKQSITKTWFNINDDNLKNNGNYKILNIIQLSKYTILSTLFMINSVNLSLLNLSQSFHLFKRFLSFSFCWIKKK